MKNELAYLTLLLKKIQTAKTKEEFGNIVFSLDYSGCDVGLYLPYLDCEIPCDKYEVLEYLRVLDKAPETPTDLQDDDYEFWCSVCDAYQMVDTEVDLMAMWRHKDKIIDAIIYKLEYIEG